MDPIILTKPKNQGFYIRKGDNMKPIKNDQFYSVTVVFFIVLASVFAWCSESTAVDVDAFDSQNWFHSELMHSFGRSVSYAGDFNDDGRDDFIVGAPGSADETCWAYIFYGPDPSEPPVPRSIDAEDANVRLEGPFSGHIYGSKFGHSVAGGGDYNGDGYDDVIVGAPNAGPLGQSFEGCVYVYFGREHSYTDETLVISSNLADLTLHGEVQGDQFGWSVAFAGHLNDDDLDDVVVGAPQMDAFGGVGRGGKVYCFFAYDTMGIRPVISAENASFTHTVGGGNLGYSVAGVGDVDNDGYDEFIVGAPLDGYVRDNETRIPGSVYYYARSRQLVPRLQQLGRFWGSQHNGRFGWSVAAAGDVNADGHDDMIVGAPSIDSMRGDPNVGCAYVILGRPRSRGYEDFDLIMWSPDDPDSLPPGVFQLQGESAYDYFGDSVGIVGDTNADGFDDFIVGADRQYDPDVPPSRQGRAYIFAGREADVGPMPSRYGGISGWGSFIHLFAGENGLTFVGEEPLQYFGFSLAGGFYWTQEGLLNTVVGSPGNKSVYLFHQYVGVIQQHRGFSVSFQNNTDLLVKGSPFYQKSFDKGTIGLYFVEPGDEQQLQWWGDVPFDAIVSPGKSVTLSVPWPICSQQSPVTQMNCSKPSHKATLFWTYRTKLEGEYLVYAFHGNTQTPQEPQNPPLLKLEPDNTGVCNFKLFAFENSGTLVGEANVFNLAPAAAAVRIEPRVLNFKSQGQRVKCTINLPGGYDERNVEPDSLLLSMPFCETCPPIKALMGYGLNKRYVAFFPRKDLINLAKRQQGQYQQILLRVSGHMKNGNFFEGDTVIRVKHGG